MITVRKECQDCKGAGMRTDISGQETIECNICSGTGSISISEFDLSDLEDKLNDILDKCNDIFEKVS